MWLLPVSEQVALTLTLQAGTSECQVTVPVQFEQARTFSSANRESDTLEFGKVKTCPGAVMGRGNRRISVEKTAPQVTLSLPVIPICTVKVSVEKQLEGA
ncbi:hypothetical protein QEG98_29135 [Myxococcus sp. MxC21-1]|uniref:hypothetical protein n=1 Tax=Myxococcus sp. MxC21-1 TaxID=3041439 RepID=UPI00292E367C|nr:hypothetical protein [Myxococcus sp. MxC21-1]WNZ60063.1 hypothetical protein QEG98_29135 [Myxococcus sp. MxC21-1]